MTDNGVFCAFFVVVIFTAVVFSDLGCFFWVAALTLFLTPPPRRDSTSFVEGNPFVAVLLTLSLKHGAPALLLIQEKVIVDEAGFIKTAASSRKNDSLHWLLS